MDSFYTLAIGLVLLLSVLAQIQMVFRYPGKLLKVFHCCPTRLSNTSSAEKHSPKPEVIVHYAKKPTSADAGSGSRIFFSQLRNILSSPILRQRSIVKPEDSHKCHPMTCTSSSFNVTGQKLPIVDITYDYKSLRYRMFKASLRDFYGDNFPPGNVVFNSMLMNLRDSETDVSQSGKDSPDFSAENDPGIDRATKKMENEYLDPLDLFVARRSEKVETMDQIVDTSDAERSELPVKDNRRNLG